MNIEKSEIGDKPEIGPEEAQELIVKGFHIPRKIMIDVRPETWKRMIRAFSAAYTLSEEDFSIFPDCGKDRTEQDCVIPYARWVLFKNRLRLLRSEIKGGLDALKEDME